MYATQEPFTCKNCKYSFRSRDPWIEHMKTVHGQTLMDNCFKCGFCDFVCAKSFYLKHHVNHVHKLGSENDTKAEKSESGGRQGKLNHSSNLPATTQQRTNSLPEKQFVKSSGPRICQECKMGFIDEEN